MSLKAIATVAALGAVGGATYYAVWQNESGGDTTGVEASTTTLDPVAGVDPATDESSPGIIEATQDTPGRETAARTAHTIAGRVTDGAGLPLAGAQVFVGANPSPFDRIGAAVRLESAEDVGLEFEGRHNERYMRERGIVLGQYFETDREGAAQRLQRRSVFVRRRNRALPVFRWLGILRGMDE